MLFASYFDLKQLCHHRPAPFLLPSADLPINKLPDSHSDPAVQEGLGKIKELDSKLQVRVMARRVYVLYLGVGVRVYHGGGYRLGYKVI